MSSRIATDPRGRKVAIVTVRTLPDGGLGYRYIVLNWFGLFTPRGRPPTAAEMAGAKVPYRAPTTAPPVADDDELDDAEAVAAAFAEQRREPVDLIGRAA